MSVYEFGPFALDARQLLLFFGGEPVAVGPKVVETLLAMIEHPGEVVSKSALLDRIWPEGYVDEANLAQNVYVLRKLLRSHWDVEAIETIPRRGYRFIAPITLAEATPAASPSVPLTLRQAQGDTGVRRRARGFWESAFAAAFALVLIGGTAFALAAPRHVARPALSQAGARLYEIGRYYWNTRSREGIQKSLAYFAQVIDSDPKDARGYAALASANAIVGDYDYGSAPAHVYYARARAYAQKALAIDPQSAEAYAVLGMLESAKDKPIVHLNDAVRELRHAIELDPSDAPAHEWYGIALLEGGQLDQSYTELERAADLDPLSVATTHWLGHVAYLERHYDDAISYARETLDLAPHMYDALGDLGLAYEARGDDRQALAAFHSMEAKNPSCRPEAEALLASVYARMNDFTRARESLAIAQARPQDVDPADLALAYAAVGKRGVALSLFRHIHSDYMQTVAKDPRFDALRGDASLAGIAQKPA